MRENFSKSIVLLGLSKIWLPKEGSKELLKLLEIKALFMLLQAFF
jgi:hypothetical protein